MKTLLVAAALLVPVAARANPRCKVSTAPADAFKDVTGAKADDGTVTAVTRPEGELIVGVWSAGKRHHATAAYVVVKNGERCSGPIIELGDAAAVEGLADLDAESQLWSGTAWNLAAVDSKASHPAVVVTITKHGDTDVALLAVPPDGGRLLARQPFMYKSLQAIDVSLEGDGKPRDFSVVETAMPQPGDKAPHPGPPQRRTMHWKNGAYAEH